VALEILQLVEAAVYVDDLDRAERFYTDVIGLERVAREPGRHVFFRAGQSMLLVFLDEKTRQAGPMPAHGASGPGHFALGVAADSLSDWRRQLESHGVTIEKEIDWPRGGKSIYFRDPAGNSVELITSGCWGLPSGW
jgi:catechol 2,3-dioxygenase-like lactoylglutathione lyase family enzyme